MANQCCLKALHDTFIRNYSKLDKHAGEVPGKGSGVESGKSYWPDNLGTYCINARAKAAVTLGKVEGSRWVAEGGLTHNCHGKAMGIG